MEDKAISLNDVLNIDFKRIILTCAKPADMIREKIKQLSPITLQPKKGHWEKTPYGDCKCSVCAETYSQLPICYYEPKFCSNCGADMRGDDNGR